MDLYKLYGSVSTDTDAVAQLDIQVDGHIVAMSLEVWCSAADGLNDGAEAEVSFASTSGFTSNDTKSSLIHAAALQGFLTSGGGPVRGYSNIQGVAIEVAAGERIYLHLNLTGTVTAFAVGYLYVMAIEGGSARASARRR